MAQRPPLLAHSRTTPVPVRVRARRYVIAGLAVALIAIAALLVLGRIAYRPSGERLGIVATPAAPASAPAQDRTSPVDDAVAFDDHGVCNAKDRDRKACPLDAHGRRLWTSVVDAFDHYLTPTKLVGSPSPGGVSYTFSADIGVAADGVAPTTHGAPTLWVAIYIPDSPRSVRPGIQNDFGAAKDYRFGEGYVVLTRRDGTVLTMRFWGAKSRSGQGPGDLDVISLFDHAVRSLAVG